MPLHLGKLGIVAVAIVGLLYAGPSYAQDTLEITTTDKSLYSKVTQPVVETAYQRAKINYQITALSNKRALMQFLRGDSDATLVRVAALKNDNPSLIRVEPSIIDIESVAFIKEGADVTLNSPADLANYSVVIVRGLLHGEKLAENSDKVSKVDTVDQTIKMVLAGRADIAILSGLAGQLSLAKNGTKGIARVEKPLRSRPMHHYLSENRQKEAELVAAELQKMKDSGELEQLLNTSMESLFKSPNS